MVTEQRRSMEGLLTHVGTADCFITLPHPALECGIVTAWWQCQVEANTAMRGDSTKPTNGSGNLTRVYRQRHAPYHRLSRNTGRRQLQVCVRPRTDDS